MYILEQIPPNSHPKKSINYFLRAIAQASNNGQGEEEICHTFRPPLFTWYFLANVENEAQNKRMQKTAKIYTLFLFVCLSTNGDGREAL